MRPEHIKATASDYLAPPCLGASQLQSFRSEPLRCAPSESPAPNPPPHSPAVTKPTLRAREAVASVRLTSCEREFLGWLVEGYSYKQIAESMNVSTNTVRDYVRAAYKKLRVNCRTQAAVKFLRLQ